MDKYKMLCLDIDGTLLNSRHEITENTKKAIQRAANEKQIRVILVSARMPKGILFLQRELQIEQPVICYSGALIWDGGEILSGSTIPVSQAGRVYDLAHEAGVHMSLYKDDQWYIEELDYWARQESEITKIEPRIASFDGLLAECGQKNQEPNKILCMAQPDRMESFHSKIKACLNGKSYLNGSLNIYPSKPTYLEIMPGGASKTSAIGFLCERFGIRQSEVIAVGDNYNDMDMLEFAGLGVAMGNAPDMVKGCADDVTLSNDEDGVAEAVIKHMLG